MSFVSLTSIPFIPRDEDDDEVTVNADFVELKSNKAEEQQINGKIASVAV